MRAARAAARIACFALAAASAAAAMKDPTQPPAALTTAPAEGLRAPPVLQSVIIAKGSRAAIIDGQRVTLGGRFRDATVVTITEDEVVLRQDGVTQVLRMYPDVEKKAVKAADGASSRPPVRSRLP